MLNKIYLDLRASPEKINALVAERTAAEDIIPELVTEKEVRKPDEYNCYSQLRS